MLARVEREDWFDRLDGFDRVMIGAPMPAALVSMAADGLAWLKDDIDCCDRIEPDTDGEVIVGGLRPSGLARGSIAKGGLRKTKRLIRRDRGSGCCETEGMVKGTASAALVAAVAAAAVAVSSRGNSQATTPIPPLLGPPSPAPAPLLPSANFSWLLGSPSSSTFPSAASE